LVLQVGYQKLANELYYDKSTSDVTKIIVSELFKILLVIAFFHKQLIEGFSRITLKNSFQFACAPAAVYAIQNYSAEAGKNLLDGTTFNVINQCKLLSGAIFSYLILNKNQTKVQWYAIALCICGAYYFTSDPEKKKDANGDFSTGLMFTVVATVLSGVSGSLCQIANAEKLPKMNDGDSDNFTRQSYVSTAEMAIYQILIYMVLQVVMLFYHLYNNPEKDFPPSDKTTIHFSHWRLECFLPCILNAVGGILIGGFFSLDNGSVKRSMAFVVGMLFTTYLEKKHPVEDNSKDFTSCEIYGGIAIIAAVLMHTFHNKVQEYFERPHRD